MRVAVIGGVNSTQVLIDKLVEHGFKEIVVWGLQPANRDRVSGWADLSLVATEVGIVHHSFVKVVECERQLAEFEPEILFVVGLSQIVPPSMLDAARVATIGFHPTALPKGRGRAAIAWLVLEQQDGAATFFALREGVDDGPIYVQQPFAVGPDDDASSVEAKILIAEGEALDRLLPALLAGNAQTYEQDHRAATWTGYRGPEDGQIDWRENAGSIVRLVRATSRPLPGAYCIVPGGRLLIWKAEVSYAPVRGAVGRIIAMDNTSILIQAGEGLVLVTEWGQEGNLSLRVGRRLSIDLAAEIARLSSDLHELQKKIDDGFAT